MRAEDYPRPMIMLYGNRVAEQIVYADELEALSGRPNMEVVQIISEPGPGWRGRVGLIDRETIGQVFGFEDANEWLYILCGPPAMLESVEDSLLAHGVPGDQIVAEQFYYD